MDRVDADLDLLDAVEGRVGQFDAEGPLQVGAVGARVVAEEVLVVEYGECFGVDQAAEAEDCGVEGFGVSARMGSE